MPLFFNIILLKKKPWCWSTMLEVNNTNMFDIQLILAAANCKTIKKLLEKNLLMYLLRKDFNLKLMYLLRKDVTMKLIQNGSDGIAVLWWMMQIYCDVLEIFAAQKPIEYRFYVENVFSLLQLYSHYI